jgi:hypothetical protein
MKKYTPYDHDFDTPLSQVMIHDTAKDLLELFKKNHPDSKSFIANEWVEVERKLNEIDEKFEKLNESSWIGEFLSKNKVEHEDDVEKFCEEFKILTEIKTKANVLKINEYFTEFMEFIRGFGVGLINKLQEFNK